MSLRFTLGRAGSGKTWRCLTEIADELRREPSPRAPRLLWLLPEQATAQAEQALLRQPGIGGFARAQVLSFRRMALMVESERAVARPDFLDEQGRQMLLRAIVGRHRDELQVFGASAGQTGFIARLATTFTELAHFRHGFDDLRALAEHLEQTTSGNALLTRKLREIAAIGAHWEAETRERFSDPAGFLDSLALRLEQSDIFHGARVWIDGFASFMPQELRVLEQVLRRAREVRVALLLDPERLAELPDSPRALDPTRLFAQTEETWLRLSALASEAGIEIEEPVILPEAGQTTRFSPSPALAGLEERLAESGMVAGPDATAPELADGLPAKDLPPILCVEAANIRAEVEAVARSIRRLVRHDGRRYRDVAVVVRDIEAYQGLVREAFERHHIPYFIDRRRPLAHHPLVELLRSAVRAVEGDWAADDVVHYLKTDFAPIARDEADRLENYAIERAVRGADWWTGDRSWDARDDASPLDPVRKQALAPLADLARALRDARADGVVDGADFADILLEFLGALACNDALRLWSEQARESGDLDAAEEHEQVWDMVMAFLARMRETLAGESLPLDELAGVLEAGLASLALGLVPPSLDEVLVGSVERSRQPELHAIFVLGLNDRVFPHTAGEDAVFTDSEREVLQERCGFDLAPSSAIRLFRERYLGYVALTRASRHLWVSWPGSDAEGRVMRPSPFVDALFDAAPTEAIERRRIDDEWLTTHPEAIETPTQAAEAIARSRAPGTDAHSSVWRLVAARSDEVEGLGDAMSIVARGRQLARGLPDEALNEHAESLPDTISVSRLETFAQCPFQYFSTYILGLKERLEFHIQPLEIGHYHHEILRLVFQRLRDRVGAGERLDWGRVSDADAAEALDRAMQEVTPTFLEDGPLGDEQVRFYRERSHRILALTLDDLMRHGRIDQFEQTNAELAFGFPSSPVPAFRIDVPNGRPLRLHGVIDRLDTASASDGAIVRVIDFKSSDNRLTLDEIRAGAKLQLPLYLLAVVHAAAGSLRPSGMYYYPVRHSLDSVTAPPEPRVNASGSEPAPTKLEGLTDLASLNAADPDMPGNKARTVAVSLKTNGEPAKTSKAWLPPNTIATLCEWARETAAYLGQDLQQGHIGVHPLQIGSRTPCVHCAFADVCRMDPAHVRTRQMPPTDHNELLDELEMAAQDSPAHTPQGETP